MRPSTPELDRLWADPARWNRDGSYQGTGDPRLFVRKIYGGGWTLNMAHRGAPWVMASILGAIVIVVAVGIRVARG